MDPLLRYVQYWSGQLLPEVFLSWGLLVCFAQVQFNKTRQNEEEEGKLREELKSIDQQIKKLRQSSKSSSKQGDEIQALADARRFVCMYVYLKYLYVFSSPVVVSVVCPTGTYPPLRLARRPNRGHVGTKDVCMGVLPRYCTSGCVRHTPPWGAPSLSRLKYPDTRIENTIVPRARDN